MATAAHVTAETIRCRKCSATGLRNFARGPVYLEGGIALDVVSCRICSQWYCSRPLATKAMKREVPTSENGHQGVLGQPCTVAGCPGLINPAKNKSGLCNGCFHKLSNWKTHGSKGLPPVIRTATGYITRAAHLAAQPKEITHVEKISELPCLAPTSAPPPSPEAAVRHPQRRPAQLRRDDHSGVNELARLLAPLGLYPDAAIIASWTPAERREVEEFVASLDTDQTVPLPDILCPIYDALYAERSA